MAKLYYKFGAMKSGKTRDLIKTWYNYKEKGMNVIIMKPGDDKKAGENIQSRANEELKADFIIPFHSDIYTLVAQYLIENTLDCILVDEAQFLTAHQIDELSEIVDNFNIPVLCYGLKVDAFTNLFTGSKRLFEVADAFEELEAVCKCGAKATYNIRYDRNKETGELTPVFEGPQVSIDGIDSEYDSMCRSCYKKIRKQYVKKEDKE